jgi:trimethylamine:corrinoid methyltransferase-like protein
MSESVHERHRHSSERRRERKQVNVAPPGLSGGWYKPLKEVDLRRIHEASLTVLEQTGIEVMPSECREIFLVLLEFRGLTRRNGPTPPNQAKYVETKSLLF